MVLPDGFVAFNAYEVFRGSQVTVEFGSRHYDFFIFGSLAARTLGDLYADTAQGANKAPLLSARISKIDILSTSFIHLSLIHI